MINFDLMFEQTKIQISFPTVTLIYSLYLIWNQTNSKHVRYSP
jgi:hypothetical protein